MIVNEDNFPEVTSYLMVTPVFDAGRDLGLRLVLGVQLLALCRPATIPATLSTF